MTQTNAAVVVSSASPPADSTPLGRDNYSYSFAVRQFRPLLERWGAWREVRRPESQADFALRRARELGLAPFHLNFAPFHAAYLAQSHVFVGIYSEEYGWVAPGMDRSGVEDELVLGSALPQLLYVREPAPRR